VLSGWNDARIVSFGAADSPGSPFPIRCLGVDVVAQGGLVRAPTEPGKSLPDIRRRIETLSRFVETRSGQEPVEARVACRRPKLPVPFYARCCRYVSVPSRTRIADAVFSL